MEWVLLGLGAVWAISLGAIIVLLERAPLMEEPTWAIEEPLRAEERWEYDETREAVAVAG